MRVCIYCEISKHKYTQNGSMEKGFQVSRLYPLFFFDKCVSTDRYPKENMCITNILQKKTPNYEWKGGGTYAHTWMTAYVFESLAVSVYKARETEIISGSKIFFIELSLMICTYILYVYKEPTTIKYILSFHRVSLFYIFRHQIIFVSVFPVECRWNTKTVTFELSFVRTRLTFWMTVTFFNVFGDVSALEIFWRSLEKVY